jgi:hypothetical protein
VAAEGVRGAGFADGPGASRRRGDGRTEEAQAPEPLKELR